MVLFYVFETAQEYSKRRMINPHTFRTLENQNVTKMFSKSRRTIHVKNINLNSRKKPRQLSSTWNDNYSMWSKFDQDITLHKQYIEEMINDTIKIWFNV